MWDTKTAEVKADLESKGRIVSATPNEDTFVVGDPHRWEIIIWHWKDNKRTRIINSHEALKTFKPDSSVLAILSSIEVSPDGIDFLTTNRDGKGVVVWDFESGKPRRFLNASATSAVFSSDNKYILIGNQSLSIFDRLTGELIKELVPNPSTRTPLPFDQILLTANDSKIITARGFLNGVRGDAVVEVFDLKTGNSELHIDLGDAGWFSEQGVSAADGGNIFLVMLGNSATIFHLSTGKQIQSFQPVLTPSEVEKNSLSSIM